MITEKTFKEFEEEIKTLKKVKEEMEKGKIETPEDSEDFRQPISIDKVYKLNIVLSWGGPSDGFTLLYDNNKELIGGYYWRNWDDHEKIDLTDEEAELIEDLYLGGDGSAWLE